MSLCLMFNQQVFKPFVFAAGDVELDTQSKVSTLLILSSGCAEQQETM